MGGTHYLKRKWLRIFQNQKKHIILKPMVKKEIIMEILKYLEQENRDLISRPLAQELLWQSSG